jgi:hypothetical protein
LTASVARSNWVRAFIIRFVIKLVKAGFKERAVIAIITRAQIVLISTPKSWLS